MTIAGICFFARRHHGSESSALRSPLLVVFAAQIETILCSFRKQLQSDMNLIIRWRYVPDDPIEQNQTREWRGAVLLMSQVRHVLRLDQRWAFVSDLIVARVSR
jgi:hypothetical protein